MLEDHLGSTDVITDSSGAVYVRESNDAFGMRRGTAWAGAPTSGELDNMNTSTRRGFTFHEHLDSTGLIHMNGRLYDPAIGRFVSADPTVPYALSTQSHNRYSYTQNNPLSRLDLTGFTDIKSEDEETCVSNCDNSSDNQGGDNQGGDGQGGDGQGSDGQGGDGHGGDGRGGGSAPNNQPRPPEGLERMTRAGAYCYGNCGYGYRNTAQAPSAAVTVPEGTRLITRDGRILDSGTVIQIRDGRVWIPGGGFTYEDGVYTVLAGGGYSLSLPEVLVVAYQGKFHDKLKNELAADFRAAGAQVVTELGLCFEAACAQIDIFGRVGGHFFAVEVKTGNRPRFTGPQMAVYPHLSRGGLVASPDRRIVQFGWAPGVPLPPIRLFLHYQLDANSAPSLVPIP